MRTRMNTSVNMSLNVLCRLLGVTVGQTPLIVVTCGISPEHQDCTTLEL